MQIGRYTEADKQAWDDFVQTSKNATFLFLRDYMNYHGDRFADHSLMIRNTEGRLLALLSGHFDAETFSSHAGLTYGGFLTGVSMTAPAMMRIFDSVLTYLQSLGAKQFFYKTIPHIYHRLPAEEDRYPLLLSNAQWVRCGVLSVVDRRRRLSYQDRRMRRVKKAKGRGLRVAPTGDFDTYWTILSDLLRKAYSAKPVHTVEEIRYLSGAFPEHIKLFGCFDGSRMLAGTVIYESERVARVQYNAASDAGRDAGAGDLLFDHLLSNVYAEKDYFDFGTSEEDGGRGLNGGLIDQKEGFGARAVALDQYVVDLTKWESGAITRAIL